MTIHVKIAALFLSIVVAIAAAIWVSGGWLHVELLPISEHVKDRGWLAFFDWRFFDGAPRLRPLSDFIEVLDALARPRTTFLFGHHASFSVSSVLMFAASAALFFMALRERLSRAEAMMFTAVLISTIGFLSCFVPYIRPAKRLALLALCATLFLALRVARTQEPRTFNILIGVLVLACLSDEAGFVFWLIALLYLRPRGGRLIALLAVPAAYVALGKWLLPPLYSAFGQHGSRAISADGLATILPQVMSVRFLEVGAKDLGSSIASNFGVLGIPLAGLVALCAIALWFRRDWTIVATCASTAGLSLFLTSLDAYNGFSSQFIAQLNYYYHSPIAVLCVLLAALCYARLKPLGVAMPAAVVVVAANLFNFHNANTAIMAFHLYPGHDPARLEERFEDAMPWLPDTAAFRRHFAYYHEHPMGSEDYWRRFARAYEWTK